jgi:cytosine permease
MTSAESGTTETAPTPATIPPKSWQWGIAPHYIGLFLWIAYTDGLAVRTLPVGGLPATVLGAMVAGGLCFLLLYYAPAMLGLRSGRSLIDVAAPAFGERGATWLPGVLIGVVQVIWFAVALSYAIDFTFRGLVVLRLLDGRHLQFWTVGTFTVRSPLFLITAAVWSVATALIGVWAVRLISALMNVYPVFPALALAGAMLWALPGLSNYQPPGIDLITAEVVSNGEVQAFAMTIQLIVGFFATAGVAAVDWGAASRDARDVRVGGLVGVAFAAFLLATIALVTVAGAQGRRPSPALDREREAEARLTQARSMRRGLNPIVERARRDLDQARRELRTLGVADYSLGAVLQHGVGGPAGGAMLLIFGLGSMAPAVYAGFVLGQRFAAAWPILPRPTWTLIGCLASLPLIAFKEPSKWWTWYGPIGAAMAPLAGILAADFVRSRGRWLGPRPGVVLAGPVAWLVGFAVGLLPQIGRALRLGRWSQAEPAAVFAFLAAFVVYWALISFQPNPASRPGEIADPAPSAG